MGNVLGFLLFVLPLGVDTFAIAAAVGANRPSGPARWRISAVFVIFEGGMPLAGLALGASLGHTVGSIADYLSGGLLIILGGYLWWADSADDDDDEGAKARRLTGARGLALIGLALSISLDELAIGFSLGLGADLTTPATIVAVIAIQTLVVSQLGLSLGLRINERLRECIERFAGPMLIVLGTYLLAEALIRIRLVTVRDVVVLSILILALVAFATIYRYYPARTQTLATIPRLGYGRHRAIISSKPRCGRHRAQHPRSPVGSPGALRIPSSPVLR
jgi:putative Mn2+ efflux pump MntP